MIFGGMQVNGADRLLQQYVRLMAAGSSAYPVLTKNTFERLLKAEDDHIGWGYVRLTG